MAEYKRTIPVIEVLFVVAALAICTGIAYVNYANRHHQAPLVATTPVVVGVGHSGSARVVVTPAGGLLDGQSVHVSLIGWNGVSANLTECASAADVTWSGCGGPGEVGSTLSEPGGAFAPSVWAYPDSSGTTPAVVCVSQCVLVASGGVYGPVVSVPLDFAAAGPTNGSALAVGNA